jgi:hypothetical protein
MARKVNYPIRVVSGDLSDDVVRRWFPDAPNIAFLQKPFTVEPFVGDVEKHFEPGPAGKWLEKFANRPAVSETPGG